MAAVTHVAPTTSTTNTDTYASAAFTPALNELILLLIGGTATATATPAILESVGGTYTLFATALKASSGDRLYGYVANQLAAATSRTETVTFTSDAATGCVIQPIRISGMTRTGLNAIKQFKPSDNQSGGTTPTVNFDTAALTGNPTIAALFNATNPATVTPPTGWTERVDTGFTNPTSGWEYASRDSGFTGTQIQWGSTSGSAYCALIIELDTSAAAAGQPTARRWGGVPHMGGKRGFNGSSGGGAWGRSKVGLYVPKRFAA